MKPPPRVLRGSGGRHKRSGSVLLSPSTVFQTRKPPQAPAERFVTLAPEDGIVFARRERCRRCSRSLWAWYFLNVAGERMSQRAQPLQPCRNMPLCNAELQGLEPGCMSWLIAGGWNA